MSSVIKIKENRDFRRAYAKGKTVVTPFAVVYVLKNRVGKVRLGITAGKKIGKAVLRNRAKRVITAAFADCLPNLFTGYDYVIVARVRILNAKSTDVALALKKAFISQNMYGRN